MPWQEASPSNIGDDLARIAALVRSWSQLPTEERQSFCDESGLHPLTGGINSNVFSVETSSTKVCVKLYRVDDRHRAEREWHAINFLAKQAPSMAPEPLAFFPDGQAPVVVMEFLPGRSLVELMPIDAEMLRELQATIRALHSFEPSHVAFPYPAVATARFLIHRVESWLAEMDSVSEVFGMTSLLRPLMRRWLHCSERDLLLGPVPFVFSHGDSNLANRLWDGSTLRLIDFEYAGWNDPMVDLADHIEGVWARPVSDDRWAVFLDEFNLAGADRVRLNAARRLCAFHWVYLLSKKLTHDPTARTELSQQIERALMLLS